MTKEEKLVVINAIAEQLQAYPHFYIADIEALNAEQTAALRRKCYESDIKLVVVKNTLLAKALEKVEKADAELVKVLEGSTSIMFGERSEGSCGSDQGIPQEVREARPEGGFRRRVRLRGRQSVGRSVQHQVEGRAYRRYHCPAPVPGEECYFCIAG